MLLKTLLAKLGTLAQTTRCPNRPFPIVVGSNAGDVVYLDLQTGNQYAYMVGYSTSNEFIDPGESKSAIYHVIDFENLSLSHAKYFTTSLFKELHQVEKPSNNAFYCVSEYPGFIVAGTERNGDDFQVFKVQKSGGAGDIKFTSNIKMRHESSANKLLITGVEDARPNDLLLMIFDLSGGTLLST